MGNRCEKQSVYCESAVVNRLSELAKGNPQMRMNLNLISCVEFTGREKRESIWGGARPSFAALTSQFGFQFGDASFGGLARNAFGLGELFGGPSRLLSLIKCRKELPARQGLGSA